MCGLEMFFFVWRLINGFFVRETSAKLILANLIVSSLYFEKKII